MNPANDHDMRFDAQAQRLHASALAQLSPQTLARLRSARRQAQPVPRVRRHGTWLTATAFSVALAAGIGVHQWSLRDLPVPTPAATVAESTSTNGQYGTVNLLDENPDLYLWLASSEAQPLAME